MLAFPFPKTIKNPSKIEAGRLPGGSPGASGGVLLGASWRPGLPWGLLGRLQGAPEPENTVKTTYFHVFCRVSGGAGDPPKFETPGFLRVIRRPSVGVLDPSSGGRVYPLPYPSPTDPRPAETPKTT